MSRSQASSDADVRALLEEGKELPRVPEAVRARVLARARLAAASPVSQIGASTPPSPRLPRYVSVPVAGTVVAGGIVAAAVVFNAHGSSQDAPLRAPTA